MPSVDLAFQRGADRDTFDVGAEVGEVALDVPRFQASKARCTMSTFSCDIAYSDSPAASKASPSS